MPINGSEAARHDHKGASCQRVGGGDPGGLARLRDPEGGCDVEAAAHAGAEGEHGYDVGQDEEDGYCGLPALSHGGRMVFDCGRWSGRCFGGSWFFFKSGTIFEVAQRWCRRWRHLLFVQQLWRRHGSI